MRAVGIGKLCPRGLQYPLTALVPGGGHCKAYLTQAPRDRPASWHGVVCVAACHPRWGSMKAGHILDCHHVVYLGDRLCP